MSANNPIDFTIKKDPLNEAMFSLQSPIDSRLLPYETHDAQFFLGLPDGLISANGYFVYGIDGDSLLRVANVSDAVTAETYTMSVGNVRSVTWNPLGKIALTTTLRRLIQLSYDVDTEIATQDFNIAYPSDHGLHTHDIVYDSTGDLYVGHYEGDFDGSPHPLKKYSGVNGSVIWQSFGGLGTDSRSVGVRVAMGNGELLYAGFCQDFGELQKGYLKQIDKSDGSSVWTVNLGDDRPTEIVGDIDGGVIVAHSDKAGVYTEESYVLYPGLTLTKYDSSGTQVWQITETNMTKVKSLCIDLEGNLYVGGEDTVSTNGVVVKYSAGTASVDPAEQWVATFNNGSVWDMASDGSNYLLVGSSGGRVLRISIGDGTVDYNISKDSGTPQVYGIDVHPGNPATIDSFELSE